MAIEGLSHITFIVKDLDRTTSFLTKIFAAEEIYSSGDATFSISRENFFWIKDIWIAVMEGDAAPDKTYNHIAFKILHEVFDEYLEKIHSLHANKDNLNQAYNRVKANKGAPGTDGLSVKESGAWIKTHKDELIASLKQGSNKETHKGTYPSKPSPSPLKT